MTDTLRPAEDALPVDVDERDYIPFDLVDHLAAGENILSVARTLEAIDGTDSSASSRLYGVAQVSGTIVRQWVEGVVDGVTYLLRITATTSDNGRRIVLAARFKGVRVS